MIRVLAVSDLHVTAGKREADQVSALARILEDARALRPSLVLLGGDFYGHTVPHRSSPHEREILAPWVQALSDLAPVLVLYGNHDYPEDLEILGRLGGLWPVRVVTEPEIVRMDTAQGPVDVAALPYPKKRAWVAAEEARSPDELNRVFSGKLRELLDVWGLVLRQQRAEVSAVVLAAHVQVSGSRTGGGEVLIGGEPELSRQAIADLPIDVGILGHIHLPQEAGRRTWYAGSPWPQDFGELHDAGYLVADVGTIHPPPLAVPLGRIRPASIYTEERDARAVSIHRVLTGAAPLVSLTWRWGVPHGSEVAAWLERPSSEEIQDAAGSHVRARLHVQPQARASLPWEAEIAAVKASAASWTEEIQVETSISVRAPEVSAAETTADKLRAYWRTLKPAPAEELQAGALVALEDLETGGAGAALARISELRTEVG